MIVFGSLGISLCFHRLLTHRGLVCPKPLEHAFAILGVCCIQDTPARWVATHRRHHEHADTQPDPHSPLVHFLWAHMGWLMFKNRDLTRLSVANRYAKDILRDPFYARLERKRHYYSIVAVSWLMFLPPASVPRCCSGIPGVRPSNLAQRAGLGRVAADRSGLAHHLGGQLGDPYLGLPQLCDR